MDFVIRRNSLKWAGLLKQFFILSFLLILFMFKPIFLLIFIFYALDILKSIIKTRLTYLPLDLVFVFGITISYYYSPVYSIIIYALGHINRMIFGLAQGRQFTEMIRSFLLFFLVPLFAGYPFLRVAMLMLGLKYILKLIMEIVTKNPSFIQKLPFYLFNVVGSLVLFYFLELTHFMFI